MAASQSEHSESLWMELPAPSASRLDRDLEVDVIVIGCGIAGLSTAYELCTRGRAVAVVDRGPIARGMTARTTAHLASALDDYYHRLIEARGKEHARIVYRAQAAAIDRIESIQREEKIACDFRRLDGYLFLARDGDPDLLKRELEACVEIGFAGVDRLDAAPLQDRAAALRFPRQARFHPLKYIHGLAAAITRHGGRLFAETCVNSVEEKDGRVCATTAEGYRLTAGAAVVATNSPIVDLMAIHSKQAPYRTYVVAAPIASGSVTDALFWDTGEPYHYVRLQPADGRDLLIVGGEDHKTGTADDAPARFQRLEDWAKARFPAMEAVEFRWSGQVLEPLDGAAFIGRNPGNRNIYIATGDSGQGMTNGALAGMLLSEFILSGESIWAAPHDPARKPLSSAKEFISENTTAVKSMAEHFTGGEVDSEREIAPGTGALVRSGMSKMAVWRDASGAFHRHSATCTHAGCVIHWNSFEMCWDCPCHGSHFAPDGTAINGPAVAGLTPATASADQLERTDENL
jgi:glycine/D-amino acid oxidase-like deaminating enzyme/nitrite reductase/ring-hydroxylating ferredoxin subunit